jgi:ubiquinone/menaquinone biosynthesis C-methylase UbiE
MDQATPSDLKTAVQDFWNADPCGSRYQEAADEFEAHRSARYSLEPYIFEFARFAEARGQKVLEIGVGMGADYLEWLKAGAVATGIDLSTGSIERAKVRCERAGMLSNLRQADAERLPFPENTFDIVYSYGVMHHSPDTPQCVAEACRVLKPGGSIRIMVYHHPSLTGLMLWARYGALQGKSLRRSVYDHLESPGTKTYTVEEARSLMSGFEEVEIRQVFSPGDLLLHKASERYRSVFYSFIWKIYPRWLLKRVASRWGLFLLIEGKKPFPTPSGPPA